MNTERARELLKMPNWAGELTDAERGFVQMLWNRMPGYTCMHDALTAIAYGRDKYWDAVALFPVMSRVIYNGVVHGVVCDISGPDEDDGKGPVYFLRLENGNPCYARNEQLEKDRGQ